MEERSNIADLLFRYFIGTLDAAGEQDLEKWRNQSVNHHQLLENIDDIDWVFAELQRLNEDDHQARISRLREKMALLKPPPPAIRSWLRQQRGRIATGAIILVIVISILLRSKEKASSASLSTPDPPVAQAGIGNPLPAIQEGLGWIWSFGNLNFTRLDTSVFFDLVKRADQAKYTGIPPPISLSTKDKPAEVVMPDGSIVRLNDTSCIRFAPSFGTADRQLQLSGEGEFKIKHGSWNFRQMIPDFVVYIPTANGMLRLEAEGTQFHIRAYDNESTVRVSLSEGSLQITKDRKYLHTLLPGEIFVSERNGEYQIYPAFEIPKPPKTTEPPSIDKYIFFDDLPVAAILDSIGRLYHKQIVCQDSITNNTSVRILPHQTLEEVLRGIERTNPIHFEIRINSVVVSH